MQRGDIWTVSGAGYAGKPRPAVILQDDRFDATASVTLCVFTTDETDAPLFRIVVEPDAGNGLAAPSRLMADKIVTVSRDRLGRQIGRLANPDLTRLERAVMVFLGLA
ncbi:MAG: type II toxin-antitoxin system PemK/MazF family toxin [Alphaproteobacteria bacterium]|jgi:mRNA interferase MazF